LENLEANAVVTAPSPDAAEDRAVLRRELALRILLQNLLLILSLAVFSGFAIFAMTVPQGAWAAASMHGAAGLAAALQWCHHGIRTKQIKDYLLSMDGGAGSNGWENWLAANRPKTLLGSRWMISTKVVFIGLQFAMMVLAVWISPSADGFFMTVSVVMVGATTVFLITNPKE